MTRNLLLAALITFLFWLTGQALVAMDDETLYRFLMATVASLGVGGSAMLVACLFAKGGEVVR